MGVAPNGVITYVSQLYPGLVSDKAIVQQSGLLNHLTAEDLVPADKGCLIEDLVPNGISVNIPPFLNNETFSKSEASGTKAIVKCSIHVKRANARLKDMKLYSFIFMLSCRHNISAVCITWQFAVPSIREGCEGYEFD